MSMRAPVRWKEWIPLATQQQRLRNLIQVIAYNLHHDRTVEKSLLKPCSYYFTLHSAIMGAPFYMSEQLESEHPKWKDVEIPAEYGTHTGVIIRLWQHCPHSGSDKILSVSGVYFSGLAYIGPRLQQMDPGHFKPNSFVFYMHGGYFTCADNFLIVQPESARHFNISLDPKQVRRSYTINMLSKLHTLQREIKLELDACEDVRQKIAQGGSQDKNSRIPSAALRRLLSQSKSSAASREQIASVKLKIEDIRFRVQLLRSERLRYSNLIQTKTRNVEKEKEVLQDLGCDLMNKYFSLNKDNARILDKKRMNEERTSISMNIAAQLVHRRRQLISDLNYIFPIKQVSPDRYEICSVFLASSEQLGHSSGDLGTGVGLGMVASLIQAIATFLSVPLSYPVIQSSSRSKILDPITVDIPDPEREFALYPRGSSYKHEFHYGVYLINKNIAQLRQALGLPFVDAKNTLANLYAVLNHRESIEALKLDLESRRRRSFSSSQLDPAAAKLNAAFSSQLSPISSSLQSSSHFLLHKTSSAPIMIRDKANAANSDSTTSTSIADSHSPSLGYYDGGSPFPEHKPSNLAPQLEAILRISAEDANKTHGDICCEHQRASGEPRESKQFCIGEPQESNHSSCEHCQDRLTHTAIREGDQGFRTSQKIPIKKKKHVDVDAPIKTWREDEELVFIQGLPPDSSTLP